MPYERAKRFGGNLESKFPKIHSALHKNGFRETLRKEVHRYFPRGGEKAPMKPLGKAAQRKLETIYRFMHNDAPAYPAYRFYRDNRNLFAFETRVTPEGRKFSLYIVKPDGELEGAGQRSPYFSAFGEHQGKTIKIDEFGNRNLPGRHVPLREGQGIPGKFADHKGRGQLHALVDFLRYNGYETAVFDNVRSLRAFERMKEQFGVGFETFTTQENRPLWGLPNKGEFMHVRIKLN